MLGRHYRATKKGFSFAAAEERKERSNPRHGGEEGQIKTHGSQATVATSRSRLYRYSVERGILYQGVDGEISFENTTLFSICTMRAVLPLPPSLHCRHRSDSRFRHRPVLSPRSILAIAAPRN